MFIFKDFKLNVLVLPISCEEVSIDLEEFINFFEGASDQLLDTVLVGFV